MNEQFIKLRDKYNDLSGANAGFKKSKTQMQDDKDENEDPNVRYAYITFRSMDAVKLV